MKDRIYLASPHISGKEMDFIDEAFKTNWIAPLGKNVDEFEREVASIVGTKYAVALSSGTGAIHLALKWFGVGQGDYVFCSSLTFIGSCNAIIYEKAIPVFIDSEPNSLNMSPQALLRAFEWAQKNNKLPKAVIVVNLYGASADYSSIMPICKKYNVPILEDAAESFGAVYDGKPSGSFGDISILSFNGNKIITTSGGGMLLTNNEAAATKARFWATQSRDKAIHYQHSEIGYNYRMSNICAGIGRGQLFALEQRVAQKKEIHRRYAEFFAGTALEIFEPPSGSSYWLTTAKVNSKSVTYQDIIHGLDIENIEARPIWKPMHTQPVFAGCDYFAHSMDRSVADEVFLSGICLPSDTKMSDAQQNEVMKIILRLLG